MKATSELTVCVVDHGIFLPVARRIARDVKKVYYYSPWEEAFPSVRSSIGDGFEDVQRVGCPWEVKAETDLFVFPDIGFSLLQEELIGQGFPVWGARNADELEVNRGKFLNALLDTDLPMPKYQRIIGMADLREHLKDKEDKWIKISKYRGDWETMHFRSWKEDDTTLDVAAAKLGPWKDHIPFYVFDPIETTIEDGVDTYCIDGQWPAHCIHGMEAKDKAFLAAVVEHDELPEEVRKVNDAMGPILSGYGYRSFFSSEVRITEDKKSYFLDPTCRCGSPPSQVQTEMIKNYADVIWRGAHGECIDIDPVANFGVQALLTVNKGRKNWVAVDIPVELEQWVKCGFCSRIDGRLVFPPDPDNTAHDIGWLVAIGDTPQAAIESLKEKAELLPDGLSASVETLAELITEANEAEDKGMEFSKEPLPPPEIVIQGLTK